MLMLGHDSRSGEKVRTGIILSSGVIGGVSFGDQ